MSDTARVPLPDGSYAIVDKELEAGLLKYEWQIQKKKRSVYAYTIIKGRRRTFKMFMHRLIAQTPARLVTHHDNRISLDNRRRNLINMTKATHRLEHINNPYRVISTISSRNFAG